MIVCGKCEWYVASVDDMSTMSAVKWSTLQYIISVFVCLKDVQNITMEL
jgi:coenzyme F420-reducing hydrogenase delta subunit